MRSSFRHQRRHNFLSSHRLVQQSNCQYSCGNKPFFQMKHIISSSATALLNNWVIYLRFTKNKIKNNYYLLSTDVSWCLSDRRSGCIQSDIRQMEFNCKWRGYSCNHSLGRHSQTHNKVQNGILIIKTKLLYPHRIKTVLDLKCLNLKHLKCQL